jgi:ABC-type bacteriocin/lantibiotic exporter with double-glycine peptidase domain
MIDEFTEGETAVIKSREQLEAEEQGLIRLKDANFHWSSIGGSSTPGFSIHIPDLTFVKGKINLISGPTGSGKSTILKVCLPFKTLMLTKKALIGELHFEKRPGAFFHLPREGGVSYAAQESWCMSESIKDNILFGEPFDQDRYRKTIHDCGLEPDLKLFDDGENTEIGEKGITLSGGQKARVTLARAVYSRTEIVLLDGGSSLLLE